MGAELKSYFKNCDTENIKQFLTSKDAKLTDFHYSLRKASQKGFAEIVKLTLKNPEVYPPLDNNQPLHLAIASGHDKIVKLLLKDPRVVTYIRRENHHDGRYVRCMWNYEDGPLVWTSKPNQTHL